MVAGQVPHTSGGRILHDHRWLSRQTAVGEAAVRSRSACAAARPVKGFPFLIGMLQDHGFISPSAARRIDAQVLMG